MFSSKNNRTDFFFFALICVLVIYVVCRAALIDITHDEAYSFYNMKKFWYVEALCTGNTHWLNSAAIKLAILFNQESLLAIRWFTIISAFVFFLVTFYWISSVKELHLKLLIFSVLLLNPYILDYFSIARGYASGLMFQALALYCFVSAVKSQKKYLGFLSLFFAGLSPLSNFSYIYFFMAFCLVYFFVYYFKTGFSFFKNKKFYRDLLYSICISALVIRAFIFMTKCSNDVVGAGTPLLSEFFHVFTDGLIYRKLQVSVDTLTILSGFVFALILASTAYGIVLRKKHRNPLYLYASCILVIILSVTALNYFCFHLVLPYYRSAVFLFPTTAICFICFINALIKNILLKKMAMYSISLLLFINFLFSINFKWVFDFYIQANLKDSFTYLEKEGARHVGISPELYGGYRNYYQMTWKYHYSFFGEPIHTNLPKGISKNKNRLKEFDHIVLFPPYDMSYYKNNQVKFTAEKIFPETGTLILKVRAD
ncbi:MAG: hypothetical protein H0W61_01990 [Bacteroidetes bacterium]|nr:hypothetical protein [Bacteroidota bacterium]